MLSRLVRVFLYLESVYIYQSLQRINLALSRATVASALRNLDNTNPNSWEFSAFSQNGEDGIIDFLAARITNPNRYFFEIGSADGIENNTAWLAIAKKYCGLMVEGNASASRRSAALYAKLNLGVECTSMFVSAETVAKLKSLALFTNPDVMSLDIDGNDYYVAGSLFQSGFRPKVFVVEYNSAFGPTNSITIKYRPDFDYLKAHSSGLYYGISITAWRRFFEAHGYKFVTVDSNGVNAFFIAPECFDDNFLKALRSVSYQENFYQRKKIRVPWDQQFEMIKAMDFVEVK